MTKNEKKYIKAVFKRYNENKRLLSDIASLAERERIEKEIAIVECVLWFYDVDENPKYSYIIARWVKGLSSYYAAMECLVSKSTGHLWANEIFDTASRAAELFNLW